MNKGAYTLSDITWPMIRLYCPECHRFAQFKRAALLKRLSPANVFRAVGKLGEERESSNKSTNINMIWRMG
jgi:hypothetical protein